MEPYTQANKKREMANKMTTKYQMVGPNDKAGSTTMGKWGSGGQKALLHGKNSGKGGSMRYPQAAGRNTATKGEKAPMQHEPTNPIGKKFYQQNGPDRRTA